MKFRSISLALFASSILLAACGGSSNGKEEGSGSEEDKKESAQKEANKEANKDTGSVVQRGSEFDPEGSFDVSKLPKKMDGKDSLEAKVHGEVMAVCQKKGCWMEMDMGDDHPKMMVRFKDYEFFVPKDASGSKATMKGWAFKDTVSVKELRHYAKDKGKSEEAIDSIQEPEVRLAFKASGVLLDKKGEE